MYDESVVYNLGVKNVKKNLNNVDDLWWQLQKN